MIDKIKTIKRFKANRKAFWKAQHGSIGLLSPRWIGAFKSYCIKQDKFSPEEQVYIHKYMDTKKGAADIIAFDEKVFAEIKKAKKVKQ